MTYDTEKELLSIIAQNPSITFDELIYKSLASPEIVDKTLRVLKSKGGIKSVDIAGQKAKGWVVNRKVRHKATD